MSFYQRQVSQFLTQMINNTSGVFKKYSGLQLCQYAAPKAYLTNTDWSDICSSVTDSFHSLVVCGLYSSMTKR